MKLHKYQELAREHLLRNDKACLFMEMGLGKTLTVLSALSQKPLNGKVLIIAPIRVAQSTWSTEIDKWGFNFKHQFLNTPKEDIEPDTQIVLLSRDRTHYKQITKVAWDTIVVDELSSFKAPNTRRFKNAKKLVSRRWWGLTGTPTPNGLIDLWAQIGLIDKGERLGKVKGKYLEKYFLPIQRKGMIVLKWKLREGAFDAVTNLIKDICLTLRVEDNLDMPDLVFIDHQVELTSSIRHKMRKLAKDKVTHAWDGSVTAFNSVYTGLRQFAQGFYYNESKEAQFVHDAKLEVLDEIVEFAPDDNLLVAYAFVHDKERLLARYGHLGAKVIEGEKDIAAWNRGEIKMLIAHPAAMGHGLNLQQGGRRLVYYGLPESLELYQQMNARLWRQGQSLPVYIHRILAKGSIDSKIVEALDAKENIQNAVLNSLKDDAE